MVPSATVSGISTRKPVALMSMSLPDFQPDGSVLCGVRYCSGTLGE